MSSFEGVPVTYFKKRAGDGLYDIQQCFEESRCSADGIQCSKCTICKKGVAYAVSSKGMSSAAMAKYPKTRDGTIFFVPAASATTSAADALKQGSSTGCISIDPCSGAFAKMCCAKSVDIDDDHEDKDKKSTGIPWWTWLLVGLAALFLIALIILIVLLVRRSSSGAKVPPAAPAAPSVSSVPAPTVTSVPAA